MKVLLTTQISGTRNGQEWPGPGSVVDLPDDEARAMVSGGSAVEANADAGPKVLVPPMGVHTPGVTAMSGTQALVEAPADAASDPDGVRQALKDRAEGNTTEVPAGVGVQDAAGLALDRDGVEASVKAEEQAQKALDASAPKVGRKATSKPAKDA